MDIQYKKRQICKEVIVVMLEVQSRRGKAPSPKFKKWVQWVAISHKPQKWARATVTYSKTKWRFL